MNKEYIKNLKNKYRPIPFWAWNERLDCNETKRQIEIMHRAGLGGYFMHARGGLQTGYMSDEWFDNIEIGIEQAEKYGMRPWVYDENGWPSGFGNGKINGLGEKYQQKILRMEKGEKNTEHTICNMNGMHFYYDVNPFYVDNLDKNVVKKFIDEVYEPYYTKFGNGIEGFFTDEPQLTHEGIPWSLCLEDEYMCEYGENLLLKIEHLFKPVADYKDTRKKFYRLIAKLFSENYSGQIYKWCEERGLKFTGHMANERIMSTQTSSNGSCMSCYEFFHIPGMDWLGRDIDDPLVQLQVVSAALQTGKKQILSETFALCGHNVSFSELRRIYEWQMVRGINLLCPHLQGYSLRGIRKRDYPPAMYYQQPWWEEYKLFIDSMSRIGMLISEGKCECDTLLMHPMTTAWICYDGGACEGIAEYENSFKNTIILLEQKHIEFHLGDEILMERHGRVAGKKLIIGEMEYTTVVMPRHIDFLDNTKSLINEFKNNGGRIITAEEAEENHIVSNTKITHLKRVFDNFDMHYFVNSTNEFQTAKINTDGYKLESITGETVPFDKDYTFTPYDSLVVLDYKNQANDAVVNKFEERKTNAITTDGEWSISECSDNSITLDSCDCYFDGKLIGENMSVSEIQGKACNLFRQVDIKCVFTVNISFVPSNISLVCETPEIFDFKINDNDFDFNDEGYFRDKSFRKANIAKYVKEGINKIELNCNFKQSEEIYDDIKNINTSETIRNRLTYDMEIENIYLIGDFSLTTDGCFEKLDKNAIRYKGEFIIDKPKEKLFLKNIEKQGFPFFAGRMTVRKTFNATDVNKNLVFKMKGINAISVRVNGINAGTVIWNNSEMSLSSFLNLGENVIELTLINNLRNLLGPHHLEEGESYMVIPSSFIKGENFWNWTPGTLTEWNDGYCFVETSLL